MKKVIK